MSRAGCRSTWGCAARGEVVVSVLCRPSWDANSAERSRCRIWFGYWAAVMLVFAGLGIYDLVHENYTQSGCAGVVILLVVLVRPWSRGWRR